MIRIADMCAGIGGIRLGVQQAFGQVKCVLTSEIDKFALKTYKANFGDENIVGDMMELAPVCFPDHDLLLAGFPCQPFSRAGRLRGFEDMRGSIIFQLIRILEAKKPQAFLFENVKNLLFHDKGNTFQMIEYFLMQLGYKVYYKVLNAPSYGVPQNRERLFIVGFLDYDVNFKWPDPTHVQSRVGDVLQQIYDPKYILSDKAWEGMQRRDSNNKARGLGFGYGLVTPESKYTRTMTARYWKDANEILVKDKESANPRKITPREAARLHGFPDTFDIPVSDTQAYKQFGNGVAVPVITAIAKQMKKHIKYGK